MTTTEKKGILGLPRPLSELTRTHWDAIIVGGGHNGLVAAAYLAQAKKKVLVLESRDRLGGACTLEEPWPGVKVSPCAYVVGLLHSKVVRDLKLRELGFKWTPAHGGMFMPFEDGTSVQLWNDDAKCEAEIKAFAPKSLKGFNEMCALFDRVRRTLRPDNDHDVWLRTESPSREEIETMLGHDKDALGLLFEWSMQDLLDRYIEDEKLQLAYLGQGVIGTNRSPFDKGTASVNYHHASGTLDGLSGTWGYVEGGMGRVSFLMADSALQSGALIATGVPVGEIIPGEGVRLQSGEALRARAILSNADPKTTVKLLGQHVDAGWKQKVDRVPIEGCTVKFNFLLNELPNYTARPGINEGHHRSQINTPITKTQWKESFAKMRRGELPDLLWTEAYFQSVFDKTACPDGKYTMSVFAQYVPHTFAEGTWDSRRKEVEKLAVKSIGRFTSNFPDAIDQVEVLGPPDIEQRVGLTGGHIFQGEITPDFMWDKRLAYRTPQEGVYLCGSGTYPGGSVMGVNGRNAALTVIADLEK